LPVRFGDFLAAIAAPSYVSNALTPVIPDASFLGHERQVLADYSLMRSIPGIVQDCPTPAAQRKVLDL
jgi:hypothetical protein